LFKAVKAQLEKGPIDVITGEARYSLSEQKLIRQQLDVQVINATVESPDTEDGLQIPVKLLNCDSISQAKEKMLDTVYKNVPVSQRPQLTAIDIEYRKSPTQCVILRDEDGSNMVEYGWRRINTLDHYNITDRAIFRLVPRPEKSEPGTIFDYTGSLMVSHGHRTRTLSDGDDGMRMWHLFKQVDEDPNSSPFMSKKMVTEIYLPRMLSTKTILQQFVDDLFNSIFTLSHPPISPTNFPQTPTVNSFQLKSTLYAPGSESLPLPIKYIFDFLDNEALNAKISDPDVVHTWKNNSLALRFWVNLIKNPEFIFDINKSAIVDSCLSVIAQAFIDGCSSSDNKPTINSPTSKLLYNKEVQGYKNSVKL
jgi:plexin A